jgi:hypothetical protein
MTRSLYTDCFTRPILPLMTHHDAETCLQIRLRRPLAPHAPRVQIRGSSASR